METQEDEPISPGLQKSIDETKADITRAFDKHERPGYKQLGTDLDEAVAALRLCRTALQVAMEGRGYSGLELQALGAAMAVLDKHEQKSR
jgi:hypothetical protein